jgi:hypothetical protein
MIEKLSDQMMREIAWEHYFGAKNRAIAKDGMRLARDYYDAQIDAQAKTMEDLAKVCLEFLNADMSAEEMKFPRLCEAIDSTVNLLGPLCYLAGFLAAGGTIKE